MIPRLSLVVARTLAAALMIPLAGPAARAQIPDTFENLKVLDPGISKAELVGTMREWTQGLGVRCNHCHVGPDNLRGMDFASDEKAAKRTARRMVEMSRVLNGELLEELPTLEADRSHQVVSCFTCHRGQSTPPRSLSSTLLSVAEEEGTDAVLNQYEELRAGFHGAGVYDFSEGSLSALARDLAQAGHIADAIRVLEKNLEYFPESADSHAAIGVFRIEAGETEEARAALERALELDPGNRMATRALQAMQEEATPRN